MNFDFPESFVRTQTDLQGEAGLEWLVRLPDIVDRCARRWDLAIGGMLKPLTYNFLVGAWRVDHCQVVVKICPPHGEFVSQQMALRHFAGRGAIQLIDYDERESVLLLERCVPGTSLYHRPDAAAIEIAGSIMRRLWKPPHAAVNCSTLAGWGEGFTRLRQHFDGPGPFPPALLERAEQRFTALRTSDDDYVLLHGDLHHGNILAAEREPWLAIDPKGVIGIPAYEPATFIINETAEAVRATNLHRFLTRRVDALAETAGLDRIEVREWAIAHAVLSAWWTVEDHGRIGEFALTCAEALASG